MSSGSFVNSFYLSDSSLVHPIKVQPETLAATIDTAPNAGSAGPATSDISVSVSSSRRAIGLHPRTLSVRLDSAPAGYTGVNFTIPVPTPALWTAAGKGSAVNYLGIVGVVTAKAPEVAR